jgi:hypothetical protein
MTLMISVLSWSLLFQPNIAVPITGLGGGWAFSGVGTVEAIDAENGIITLRDEDGRYHIVHATSDIQRFDELKVGDTRKFKSTYPLICDMRVDEKASSGPSPEQSCELNRRTQLKSGTRKVLRSTMVIVKEKHVPVLTAEIDGGEMMQFLMGVPGRAKWIRENVTEGNRLLITYEVAEMRKIGPLRRK